MKPPRTLAFIAGCVLVLILAACAAQTSTPEAPGVTATPQPYPVAVSPTAAMAPMAYPAPATDTPAPIATATPTRLPSPTETPRPTQTDTPTPAPTPQVWEIWFNGFSCKDLADCSIGPGMDDLYGNYSIKSDGSDLKELGTVSFLQFAAWPPNAPTPSDLVYPALSPDATRLLYTAKDGGLYSVDAITGESVFLYKPEPLNLSTDFFSGFGAYCWAINGRSIRFFVVGRQNHKPLPWVGYVIDDQGANLRQVFVSSLDFVFVGGDGCSPDGHKVIVGIYAPDNGPASGLYVVDLTTGMSKQILANFHIDTVRHPQTAISP